MTIVTPAISRDAGSSSANGAVDGKPNSRAPATEAPSARVDVMHGASRARTYACNQNNRARSRSDQSQRVSTEKTGELRTIYSLVAALNERDGCERLSPLAAGPLTPFLNRPEGPTLPCRRGGRLEQHRFALETPSKNPISRQAPNAAAVFKLQRKR